MNSRRDERCYLRLTLTQVAALRVCKPCAAPGPMGRGGPSKPHTINRLHGSSQYNRPLLSANCLFINGPIINNIFLKIMDTLQKKSDLLSLDFTHKCSQNAGNAISETLNSNTFWQRIPPDLPTYVIILWGPNCFSRTGAHTRVVPPLIKRV